VAPLASTRTPAAKRPPPRREPRPRVSLAEVAAKGPDGRRRRRPVKGSASKERRGSARTTPLPTLLAVCIDARRRRLLQQGALYLAKQASNGQLLVRDESGSERGYPSGLFVRLKVSPKIERMLLRSAITHSGPGR
jgi:hypothetical protein